VRYDWYRRWLEQSQRMQPGTRMPSVFLNGKSTLDHVLGGRGDDQAEAIWAYLSLGPTLPLPDGLEPPRGLVLTVKERPILLRTFMPDAGSRAVAVGFPGGVSAAFDAATCRLAYAWSGNFLDASPVWDGRGGNPARVLGPRFWAAPAGCPVGVTTSNEPPDFAARANDPAYGGRMPEGKVYDGPARLRFDGYATDKAGVPTFRYRLTAGDDTVRVRERAAPLRSAGGVGINRRFDLEIPADQNVWLRAGESAREPRLLNSKGEPLSLDLKTGKAEVPAAGRVLALPQDGNRVVLLALGTALDKGMWRVEKHGSTWQVLLHVPAPAAAAKAAIDLNVWAPYRDDPALLRAVLDGRK
jgi:hypothetical protein